MVETVSTLVTTFGFPIACTMVLMWYVWNKDTRYQAERKETEERTRLERKEEREAHAAEMNAMTAALNANTEAINALRNTLEVNR